MSRGMFLSRNESFKRYLEASGALNESRVSLVSMKSKSNAAGNHEFGKRVHQRLRGTVRAFGGCGTGYYCDTIMSSGDDSCRRWVSDEPSAP